MPGPLWEILVAELQFHDFARCMNLSLHLQASPLQAAQQLRGNAVVGFDSLQGLGYVPSAMLGAGDEIELSLLPDVRAALKKLTKKDATTKLKVGMRSKPDTAAQTPARIRAV